MTTEERKAFLEKVKGKKIRWYSWGDRYYFIPDGTEDGSNGTFEGVNQHGEIVRFSIADGLSDVPTRYKWHLVDKVQHATVTPPKAKTGCECGKDKHGFANHSDWCPMYVRW